MKKFINQYNLFLFIPLGILAIVSFFCMYQAGFIKDIYHTHFLKQILWFGIGIFIILLMQKIKIKLFFDLSFYFYLFGVFLLCIVLFFGKEINGARAWFDLKLFHFQPSEFMKIALLLYLAKITNDFHMQKKNEIFYILKCVIIVLIPSFFVFLEPDTGAILFYFLLLLAVFLLSGIRKRWFLIAFLLLAFISGTLIYLYLFKQDTLIHWIGTSFFYRVDRLIHFQEGSGLQLNNALITIGNAGIFGHGIQKSLLYVPEFPTDFVFTLCISIFGFVGGIIVLLSYFTMNCFFINKLFTVKQKEYQLFIHGFLFLFLYQQLQNIFMNLGLMPIMGIPLPFLSYGGSNMIVTFLFLGFILNMTKKKTRI